MTVGHGRTEGYKSVEEYFGPYTKNTEIEKGLPVTMEVLDLT